MPKKTRSCGMHSISLDYWIDMRTLSQASATNGSRPGLKKLVLADGASKCFLGWENWWGTQLCLGWPFHTPEEPELVNLSFLKYFSCNYWPLPLIAEETTYMLASIGQRFDYHVCKSLCELRYIISKMNQIVLRLKNVLGFLKFLIYLLIFLTQHLLWLTSG